MTSQATRIGTSELAKALGISRQRIYQLLQTGKLKREPDGKWDLDTVKVALRRSLDQRHQVTPSLAGAGDQGEVNENPALSKSKHDDQDDGPSQISFHDAQRKHELAKAAKVELEVAKLRGILLPADQVVMEWQKQIVAAREHALQLPGKLAPKVAVESSVLVCQQLIDREIRALLTELSEYRPNAA